MSGDTRSGGALPRPSLRTVVGAPVRLQTYRNLLYLALSYPLGIAYFVGLAVGFGLGVGFAVLLVGVPLLVGVLLCSVALAGVERRLTAGLLAVDIDPPEWAVLAHDGGLDREGVVGRTRALVTDDATWAAVGYLASKLVVGVASFVLLLTLFLTSGLLVAVPLYYRLPGARVGVFFEGGRTVPFSLYLPWQDLLVGVEFVVRLTEWRVNTMPEALATSAVGVVALVLSLNVLNGFAWLVGRYARFMLGPSERRRAALARVRSRL